MICAKFLIAQKNEVAVDKTMGFQSLEFDDLQANSRDFLLSRSFLFEK